MNGVASNAAGLWICAAVVPGTTMSWRGFLIAFAVIEGGDSLLTEGAVNRYRDSGRTASLFVALCVLTVWFFAGPLVADRATPDFNIGGWWQYFVLLAVIFGIGIFVAFPVHRVYELGKRWREKAG
jgi:hypothetical protein